MASIHPSLIKAYRQAKYVIEEPNLITLFVGQSSRALADIFSAQRVTTAAFITAFNPYSNVSL